MSLTASPLSRIVGYNPAHERVKQLWGPAKTHSCIECGGVASDWAYDGTDPTQLYGYAGHGDGHWYSLYPEFYMPMCRRCHRYRDGFRPPPCRIGGCPAPHKARGLCDTHYAPTRRGVLL